MVNCHCSICRKASGAAYATIAFARAEDFRWRKGEDLIGRYETPANGSRSFCTKCGSKLPRIRGY
ncbi:MAG: GFA family protein [Gammaproteobacteria bacterium]|nr:GFA family protein [Gammaproteobacteria bacterium]